MIVVDASVIFKLLDQNEPLAKQARDLYLKVRKRGNSLCVPDLLYIEIANALATKTEREEADIRDDLYALSTLCLERKQLSDQLLLEATVLAKKHHTSVYDMVYAVLAKHHKARLVTADRKFIEKTKFPFITHLEES